MIEVSHQSIIGALLALIPFLCLVVLNNRKARVPSVSTFHYLPSGLLHSVVKNPDSFQTNLHKIVEKYGKTFYMWLGTTRTQVITDPADIVDVLTTGKYEHMSAVHDVFELFAPGGLITMPCEIHRAVKKTIRMSFNSCMLPTFYSQMGPAVMDLSMRLNVAAEDGKKKFVDISEELSMTTFRVLTDVVFATGMNNAQWEEFRGILLYYFDSIMAELGWAPFKSCCRSQ